MRHLRIASYRGWLVGVLFVVVIIGGLAVFSFNHVFDILSWHERCQILSRVQVGMQRKAVIERMGQPINIARCKSEFYATNSYKPVPTYPIDKEVLEYITGMLKVYVYIDHCGKVEKVFIART